MSDEFEAELLEWIESLRRQHLRVTCTAIQKKAISMNEVRDHADGEASQTFAASRGWLEKFLKRQALTLRRRTTVSQRLPQDLVPRVVGFVMHIRRILLREEIPLSAIENMDETLCQMDMPGETTVERVGVRSVPLRTTGHEKARSRSALAANI